jgi:hypothetical protein
MRRLRLLLALVLVVLSARLALAGGATVSLAAAAGTVEKAEKDALTMQSRGPDGKFGKKLVLKLTGTSKLTVMSQEKRAGKLVPVQRDVDATELEPGQMVAVIYTAGATEPILLSAVVQKAAAK